MAAVVMEKVGGRIAALKCDKPQFGPEPGTKLFD